MKLITIAQILFDTLKGTNKGLFDLLKIAAVVLNALQQEGIIEQTRDLQPDSLDAESRQLVRCVLDAIHEEM